MHTNIQPGHHSNRTVHGVQTSSRRAKTQGSDGTPKADITEQTAGTTDSGPSAGSDGSDTDEDESEAELPLDQVFEILKNSRRRQTLHYLLQNGGEGTLSELAEHIAALENDVEVRAITSSQRKRVYVGLYQCHLPKMDDMNIVDFEKNRGTVEIAANAKRLEPYLSLVAPLSIGLTPTVVLVALLAVMAICSITHAYYSSESE